jgi:hypothetical protein
MPLHPHVYDKAIHSNAADLRQRRRWLRVRAAAAHLDLGVGTMNKLRIYGGGPPYSKLGSVVVYDIEDLDRWASERKVRSTSEPVRAA